MEDKMMNDKIRWGIIGTGSIAHKFAQGLSSAKNAELLAVGSRAAGTADKFGDEFSVHRRYDSYEKLAGDADIQAVYISTPHPMHKDNAILCLQAGKAVLCEKPFTINAKEASKVIAAAREKNVFLMEAMWTRFLPVMVKLRELLAGKAIGKVRMLQADFGFRATFNPLSRLFKPKLGGGGLLDVGVYPISRANMLFGDEPENIVSLAEIGMTGIDEQAAIILGYRGNSQLAVLAAGVRTSTPQQATIIGTDATITIPSPWWHGQEIILSADGQTQRIPCPMEGNGYNYEADEVAECLQAGRLESDVMPLSQTLAVMNVMDEIRTQWKMKYPGERQERRR
jgi:predicted dehydrogenase